MAFMPIDTTVVRVAVMQRQPRECLDAEQRGYEAGRADALAHRPAEFELRIGGMYQRNALGAVWCILSGPFSRGYVQGYAQHSEDP